MVGEIDKERLENNLVLVKDKKFKDGSKEMTGVYEGYITKDDHFGIIVRQGYGSIKYPSGESYEGFWY